MRVALGVPASAELDAIQLAALPAPSLAIDAGLQLAGVIAALAAAGFAARRAALAVSAFCIAITMALVALPVLRSAGLLSSAGVALATTAVLIGVYLAGRLVSPAPRNEPYRARPDLPLSALAAAGVIAAVVGPHLYVVAGGAVIAAIAGHLAARRRSRMSAVPVLPLVVIPALLFVAYYMHIIAAPTGLGVGALVDGPFSTAAQAMLLPALALAAAGFFAPWPVHAVVPGPALTLVGVALMVRLGVPVLPAGVDGWQTVAVPIGVIALWMAALGRRPIHAASALAWIACFAPEGEGTMGAWWLAAAVLAAHALTAAFPLGRARLRIAATAVVVAAGSWGAVLALDGILRAQVVYGVIAWIGVAVASRVYIPGAHNSEPFSGASHGIFGAPPPI